MEKEMLIMYTVHIGYKTDRLWCRTEKVFAETKEEAKKMVWEMVLSENPNAIFTHANVRKSKRCCLS